MRGSIRERFEAKVRKDPNGCWVWSGAKTKEGYGLMFVSKGSRLAHRISWLLYKDEKTSAELCVLHRCDNPPCVNPDHLFLGSNADNVSDRVAKQRSRRAGYKGDAHPASKLSAAAVIEIRRIGSSQPQWKTGQLFAVSRQTVSDILTKRRWRHL